MVALYICPSSRRTVDCFTKYNDQEYTRKRERERELEQNTERGGNFEPFAGILAVLPLLPYSHTLTLSLCLSLLLYLEWWHQEVFLLHFQFDPARSSLTLSPSFFNSLHTPLLLLLSLLTSIYLIFCNSHSSFHTLRLRFIPSSWHLLTSVSSRARNRPTEPLLLISNQPKTHFSLSLFQTRRRNSHIFWFIFSLITSRPNSFLHA